MGNEVMDWIQLASERVLVKTVMNLRFPWKSENFLTA